MKHLLRIGLQTVVFLFVFVIGVRLAPAQNFDFGIVGLPPSVGNYSNTNIALSGNTTVTPDAVPMNTTSVSVSTNSTFKGGLDVDPATGVVRVTNAHPAGTYTVAVRAFSGAISTTKTFNLTVSTPAGCASFGNSAFARTDLAGGANPYWVAVGDFNGDRRQDFVAVNEAAGVNTASVFLRNAANNGFEPKVDYTVGTRPRAVAVGDINGDGRQDIIAGTRSNSISLLFRNAGNNGFDAPVSLPLDNIGEFIAVADLNGDGRLDIAASVGSADIVSVYLRNSANTGFEPRIDLTGVQSPNGIAVADFNGDSRSDILVAAGAGTASLFLRNAANTGFEAVQNIALPTNNAYGVGAGDFNGDGRQDFAVGYFFGNFVSVYLRNAANNGFEPPVNLTVNTNTYTIAVGDFNNDGRQDMATSNFVADFVYVLLRNAGNTGFDAPVSFAAGDGTRSVAVGDFNGDNRQDLVTANGNSNNFSVIQRVCDTTPPDTTILTNPNNPSSSSSAGFTFFGSDDSTPSANLLFECSLESAPFSACTSPQNYTNLSEGNHLFAVRAIDSAGNIDPTPAQFFWTIDATPPTVQLTSGAPNPTNAAFSVTATFSESVNGFDLSDIAVANGSPSAISGSGNLYTFTITPTAPGTVTVSLAAGAAQDAAGNNSAASNQLTRQFNNLSTLVVTKTTDTNDGVCDADCSLREAIAAAVSGNTIDFAPLFNSAQTITLTNGELLINKNLTINGRGANLTSVSGNNASRVFNINNNVAVNLSGLTVTGGNTDNGGGIFSFNSAVTLTDVAVVGNIASNNAGGLYNINGTMNLVNSTVSDNFAGVFGGGIAEGAAPSVLNITNSTISGNAAQSGGGIFASGEVNVRSSTITANTATTEGGGIANFTLEPVKLGNSIVAGNTAPSAPDFRDTLTSLGYNLVGDSSGAIIQGNTMGNILNRIPQLLPLGDYGGTTRTHALLANSPAINAGDPAAPATDQRGRSRVGTADIGAFEAAANLVVTNTLDTGAGSLRNAIGAANASSADETITFNIPSTDAGCVGGICTITLTSGELGINSAATAGLVFIQNTNGTADNLRVSGNNLSRVFFVGSGANAVISGVTVTGGKAPTQNVSANCNGFVCGGGIYNLGTLTVANGAVSGNTAEVGGGIFNEGKLSLANSAVNGNSASGADFPTGGGIFNASQGSIFGTNSTVNNNSVTSSGPPFIAPRGGGISNNGTVNLTNSAVSNNSISGGLGTQVGGGIFNNLSTSTVNLTNSLISGNSINGGNNNNGGGILNSGSVNLTNSTVSGNFISSNSATTNRGGGIINSGGILNLSNSTVSGNSIIGGSAGTSNGGGLFNFNDVPGFSVNLRNSIISGNTAINNPNLSGLLNVNDTSIIGNEASVRLAPLGFNGGATLTHALLSGSTAINAGNNCVLTATCASFNAPFALNTDQRGASRVGNVDIGAFEVNNSANGGNYRASLPFGRQGVNYNFTLAPNNGTATYQVTGGALPSGVNISTNFAPNAVVSLSGIPSQSGTFDFSVTTDSGGNTNVTDYRLNVIPTTSANAAISGRVFDNDGNALRNAVVLLTDANGNTRKMQTGSFGVYRFDELAVGQTYIIQVVSKKFTFAPQTVYLTDNLSELNFTAQ